MLKTFTSKLVLLFICLLLPTGLMAAERKVIKLRVAAGHPAKAAPWTENVQRFFVPELEKRVLAETKDYKVECQELYGGTLAKLGEVLEAVESGMADIGVVVQVFEMSKLHLQNHAWGVPFASTDVHMVLKAENMTYEKFPVFDEIWARYNQKLIAHGVAGSYHFVSTFPIKRLEDMKGKKMAHGGPMLPWLEALGSVAVQSRLNEAYTSLQTGVYDGWAMEPVATTGFKMYEPARYYTISGLGAGFPAVLTINLRSLKKLPPEVRKIVLKVAKEYEVFNADKALEEHSMEIGVMALDGVSIYKLPEAERVRFAEAMNAKLVADKMAKEDDKKGLPGSEVYKFYIKALSDMGYKWPVVPTIK
jgi:C4-dicarboxylate-binding protein DctP